jgi:hypothetical protein
MYSYTVLGHVRSFDLFIIEIKNSPFCRNLYGTTMDDNSGNIFIVPEVVCAINPRHPFRSSSMQGQRMMPVTVSSYGCGLYRNRQAGPSFLGCACLDVASPKSNPLDAYPINFCKINAIEIPSRLSFLILNVKPGFDGVAKSLVGCEGQ